MRKKKPNQFSPIKFKYAIINKPYKEKRVLLVLYVNLAASLLIDNYQQIENS